MLGLLKKAYRSAARIAGRAPIPTALSDSGAVELSQSAYRASLQRDVGPVPWCVDAVQLDGNTLHVSGWAIPPEGDVARVAIHADGAVPLAAETGAARPDVQHFYWFLPGAERSGFNCRYELQADGAAQIRLQYLDTAHQQVIDPWHDFYVPLAELRAPGPFPSDAQILRVHGGNTTNQFLVEGYSTYVKLQQALDAFGAPRLRAFDTILDFGCGCGRIARHLSKEVDGQLVGVDIDADAIAWCRQHLAGAEFHAVGLRPPMALPDASIDCVIAVDVFNHLKRNDAALWLKELARVSRPGATLLVSIAALGALARARLSAGQYVRFKDEPYVDLSRNADLDGFIAEDDYYRNVFYLGNYIEQHWLGFGFELLGRIPICVSNHNDLLVLRKTAD